MSQYKQRLRWSGRSVLITVFTYLLLCFGAWLAVQLEEPPVSTLLAGSQVLLMCIGSACALFFMPLAVEIDEEAVILCFSLRRRRIPLADLQRAEAGAPVASFTRTFGSGGFFGWWGWFRHRDLGRFFLYAGEKGHLVVLRLLSGRNILLSSPDPEALVEEINRRLG